VGTHRDADGAASGARVRHRGQLFGTVARRAGQAARHADGRGAGRAGAAGTHAAGTHSPRRHAPHCPVSPMLPTLPRALMTRAVACVGAVQAGTRQARAAAHEVGRPTLPAACVQFALRSSAPRLPDHVLRDDAERRCQHVPAAPGAQLTRWAGRRLLDAQRAAVRRGARRAGQRHRVPVHRVARSVPHARRGEARALRRRRALTDVTHVLACDAAAQMERADSLDEEVAHTMKRTSMTRSVPQLRRVRFGRAVAGAGGIRV
jgi:hypothetical protein